MLGTLALCLLQFFESTISSPVLVSKVTIYALFEFEALRNTGEQILIFLFMEEVNVNRIYGFICIVLVLFYTYK